MRLRLRGDRGGGADRGGYSNGSSPTPRTPSGSTAPMRRPGWPSAPTSAPAPAASAACSNTTSTPARSAVKRARRDTVEHKSIFDLLDREVAKHAVEPPPELSRRAGRRLRRLPRLRAQGRLRLAQRAQLRHAGRADDARQPGRRRRPRAPPHLRLRGRPRGRRRGRRLAGDGGRGGRRGDRRPAARRCRPRARGPLDHVASASGRGREQYLADIAAQPGRTGGRRVLRGLPHRPVLDRRQPRPLRPLPPPAPQQPGAVRRLPQVRRARDRQLLAGALPLGRPRPPRSRRARSRGRSRAATTRSSTPPAGPSWPRTKRPWPST